MELPAHVGAVQRISEHWQLTGSRDRETKRLHERSRGGAVAVTFPAASAGIGALVFRNYFVASLRLVQHNVDGTVTVLLPEHRLMQHAHCEDDAQAWHVLHADKFQARMDPTTLECLVLYLFQPSTVFDRWELQQLTFYESRAALNPSCNARTIAHSPSTTQQTPTTSPRKTHNAEAQRLTQRLSRNSVLVVDGKDVRHLSTQTLTLLCTLRELVHRPSASDELL